MEHLFDKRTLEEVYQSKNRQEILEWLGAYINFFGANEVQHFAITSRPKKDRAKILLQSEELANIAVHYADKVVFANSQHYRR